MRQPGGAGPAGRLGRSVLGVVGCLAVVAGGCGGSTPAGISTSSTSPAASTDSKARTPRDCPRTTGGRRAKGVAIALGRGPAYPVLGMQAAPPAALGVAVLADDLQLGGVYLHKTLWAVRPGVGSAIVVRAESLSSRQSVGFFNGPEPRSTAALREATKPELRLPRTPGRWAYAATSTVLPGPGCYAFHVRGSRIEQRIVFAAVLRTQDADHTQSTTPRAKQRRFTATELEVALRTNPNNEAKSAACRTADHSDGGRRTFGNTRPQLFVCHIALMPRPAEAFDVQILPNGCFVAERLQRGQADYGCIRP